MTDIVKFTYNVPANIRMVYDEDHEPWFVAKDVCDVLGIASVSSACEKLDKADKGVRQMDTPGGAQDMVIVNEPGLYWLIVRSDKPNARPFIHWVTHEVLPTIRKTGGYQLPGRRAIPAATRWGRQPLLNVIKECGYTQHGFANEVVALEIDGLKPMNVGNFFSYAKGNTVPSESMIRRCETVLGVDRDRLFTPAVLEARRLKDGR